MTTNVTPLLTAAQRQALQEVTATLATHRIRFQLTGGLAALAYGAQRPLYDIDIDLPQTAMLPVRELFRDHLTTDIHHHTDDQFDLYLMTISLHGVPLDFSQAEEGYCFDQQGLRIRLECDLSKARPMVIAGLTVPVQDRNELIGYKRIIARDTDLLDVKQMEGWTGAEAHGSQ